MAIAQQGLFQLPEIKNEPMRNYEPGSADRSKLQAAVDALRSQAGKIEVPCVVNGKEIRTGRVQKQLNPSCHSDVVCTYHEADAALIQESIAGALVAREAWERMPLNDRSAIFLRAADLLANKYRFQVMAATMVGQGKNVWQAEIDAAAESCDFLRFGVMYMHQLYSIQPPENSPGVWNRVEYRPLEGFVLAVSPFNFTAIGINLPAAPAMLGNVVVWKPSPMATYSNYLVYKILIEAGLPAGVIQFCPGPAEEVVKTAIDHPEFAALHFTGSTFVFRQLWKQMASNLDRYRSYPRIVGETGGKNFHLVHPSASIDVAVHQTIRAAFEYAGQKCSALSRLYVARSVWENGFKEGLVRHTSSISVGPIEQFQHFMGPVINKASFDKCVKMIKAAVDEGGKVLCGGKGDESRGYFMQPTIIESNDPKSVTMTTEIFGPVLTVYVYPDEQFESICAVIDSTSQYSLTGAIFSQDRYALIRACDLLKNASGMLYIGGEKCTGAVVGQQPFGGGRASGTNDRAGSMMALSRFTSARTIKEGFNELLHYAYPSNLM